jgi:hypothetical protein
MRRLLTLLLVAALTTVAPQMASAAQLGGAPGERIPLKMTAPKEVPAYGELPLSVAVPPNVGTKPRTGTLYASRDKKTFTKFATWAIPQRGGTKDFAIQAGEQVGRVWLRAVVKGKDSPRQQWQITARITSPYQPSEPDTAGVATGIPVTATLFGSHPIRGVPEFAGAVRLWDTSTSWNQIEKSPGQYSWGAIDRQVAQAQAAGQEVMLVLGGTPEWAAVAQAPGAEFAGPGSSMPMKDPAMFESYVRAVVNRYGGRIGAYQIWNEANISQFWRGTPELMADLTARAYRIIKDAVPGATVVAASTGSRWVKGFTEFYPEYLAALGAFGWPIDAFSVHLYPLASGTPKDRAYLLGMMNTALDIAGAPKKPIWETEINYGITNPGTGEAARSISDAEVPAYVARTYVDSLRYGIARSYWYGWTPEYRLLGIQMWNGYQATTAYGRVRDWLLGSTFLGCTTTGIVVQCNFDRGGAPFFVAYTDDGSAASLPNPGGTVYTGMDGATAPAGPEIPISGTPIRIS